METSGRDSGTGTTTSTIGPAAGDVYSDTEPATLTLECDPAMVHVVLRGALTEAAFIAARERTLSDASYLPGTNWLIDCRVLTAIPKPAQLTALARAQLTLAISGRIGRTAIVVLTRMGLDFAYRWQQLDRDETGMRVFTDPEDALDWLESPLPRLN